MRGKPVSSSFQPLLPGTERPLTVWMLPDNLPAYGASEALVLF